MAFSATFALNKMGISAKLGLSILNCLIQANREFLLDVPVAQIAKTIPSSCSCTEGLRIIFAGSGGKLLYFENFKLLTS